MRTLLAKDPLPLLLLLMIAPLQLQGKNWRDYFHYEENRDFAEYLEEIFGTGPTKPPTKEKVIRRIIADPDRPFNDVDYCTSEIMFKNIHYKLKCYPEIYLLKVTYEEMLRICYSKAVPCKNGIGICKKGNKLIRGMHCTLKEGTKMPRCMYENLEKEGYPLITCQWNNETKEYIPESVNDLVPLN